MSNTNATRRFTVKTYSPEEFKRTASRMRSWLMSLVRRRTSGTVTADDVHRFLDREGVRPQQVRTRLSFINSVLREPNFTYAGVTSSSRPAARRRNITEWTVA
jgi:hypothetical protein